MTRPMFQSLSLARTLVKKLSILRLQNARNLIHKIGESEQVQALFDLQVFLRNRQLKAKIIQILISLYQILMLKCLVPNTSTVCCCYFNF
ncbi:hypothetical protein BpHYR1_043109 [Brachionus plicatilis]|uniref:Uncharacterized protein n=1 Tax=Brachionus plicatilis TaxID=10195 RepID=A0A3M7PPP8_BRAPC|nr:hypothetical protein BpHYR1_043109 [Brachionus plicatilis]